MRYFSCACLGVSLFLGLQPAAFALTNSDRYKAFEADTPARLQFIRKEDSLLQKQMAADPNYLPIKAWLMRLYSPETTLKKVDLDASHALKLVDRGVGKPTELVYVHGLAEEVLVSNDEFQPDNIFNINDFTVSPDGRHIALSVDHDGSIDAMEALVYDLPSRALLPFKLQFAEKPLAWSSPSTLLYPTLNLDDSETLNEFDITTFRQKRIGTGWIFDEKYHRILYYTDSFRLESGADGAEVVIDDSVDAKFIVGADAQSTYLWCNGKNKFGEIRRFPRSSLSTAGDIVVPEGPYPIRAVRSAGHHLFVMVRNGADRWLRIYENSGKLLQEITLPNCCSLGTDVSWEEEGRLLKIGLLSATSAELPFLYDLEKGKWTQDPELSMNASAGVAYKTTITHATSQDGSVLPIRLTYRADLRPDGKRPLLFTSYGGFTASGYLDPRFDKATLEFMKRGGISASAALRGGDEFGPAWHDQGTFALKINTYYDLASAVAEVVQEGWTQPHLITSTGTSNGGLTVAATALLFPERFGLVIPVSGDMDLLGIDRMDPQFFGWDYEYGDAGDPGAIPYLSRESPLENAQAQGQLEFLIMEGIDDTRVNMAHSLKLTQALLDQGGAPARVHLAAFRNAGHWLGSVTYQSLIGLRSAALQWTMMFRQAGWRW